MKRNVYKKKRNVYNAHGTSSEPDDGSVWRRVLKQRQSTIRCIDCIFGDEDDVALKGSSPVDPQKIVTNGEKIKL